MTRACKGLPYDSVGRLYLVGLSDGRIKVGRACLVEKRVRSYMSQHQGAFLWAHIFASAGSGACERQAIRLLSLSAHRVGRSECFSGIDKHQAIAICRRAIGSGDGTPSAMTAKRKAKAA